MPRSRRLFISICLLLLTFLHSLWLGRQGVKCAGTCSTERQSFPDCTCKQHVTRPRLKYNDRVQVNKTQVVYILINLFAADRRKNSSVTILTHCIHSLMSPVQYGRLHPMEKKKKKHFKTDFHEIPFYKILFCVCNYNFFLLLFYMTSVSSYKTMHIHHYYFWTIGSRIKLKLKKVELITNIREDTHG